MQPIQITVDVAEAIASALSATEVLELAKHAEFLYKPQEPAEQRRLLESRSICWWGGTKQEIGGPSETTFATGC